MWKNIKTKIPRKISTVQEISVLKNMMQSGKEIIHLVLTGRVQMDHWYRAYQHYC
jgi:hypothetical protein